MKEQTEQSAEPVVEEKHLPCPWCIPGVDNCHHSQKEIGKYRQAKEDAKTNPYVRPPGDLSAFEKLGLAYVTIESLTAERNQLRKELEEAHTEMSEAREMMPIVRRQDFLDASLKEAVQAQLSFMNERLNYIRELETRVTVLTDDNEALKNRVRDGSEQCVTYDKEICRLRSQFRWTPISERLPTEKDAVEVPDHRGRPMLAVRWCFNSWGGPRVAVGPWNEPIKESTHWQPLSPLPSVSPPETEEQAMRREFEGWAEKNDFLHQGAVTIAARAAWQAAKQSTGGAA